MDLKTVKIGNLIKFFPTPGRAGKLGFKAYELLGDGLEVIIPLSNPYRASKEMNIHKICYANEYNSKKTPSNEISKISDIVLKDRELGVVAWTGNPLGLTQKILVLGNIDENQVLIAPMEEAIIQDGEIRIADLGPIGKYTESLDQIIKKCPNCNNDTLIKLEEEINNFDTVSICKTCGIKIAISWS